jgi:predicted nucleotidyltransferase
MGIAGLFTGLTLGLLCRDARFQTGLRVLTRSMFRLTRKKWQRMTEPQVDLARIQRDRSFIALPAGQRAEQVDVRARAAVAALKQNLTHKFAGQIQSVYLFGSRVRGDHQVDSDVDVGIFLADSCSPSDLLKREILYQSGEILLAYRLFIQPRIFGQNFTESASEKSLAEIVLRYGIPVSFELENQVCGANR